MRYKGATHTDLSGKGFGMQGDIFLQNPLQYVRKYYVEYLKLYIKTMPMFLLILIYLNPKK